MIPYSEYFLDPTLFSRDIAFFQYNLNFFFIINAYLSKWFTYETIFFMGYALSSLLLTTGVYYLTKTLFKDKRIAYLAVLLIIFAKPALSAMTTVWNYYYYKDLAMGILLISFTLFLRKKYLWSSLLLGIASLIHILFSLYFVGFYGLYFLYTYFKLSPLERKSVLQGAVIVALFLIAPIYLIVSSEQPASSPQDFQEWISILKLRSFDHFFPSTWITNSVILFLPFFILFIIFLFFLKRDETIFPPSRYKTEMYAFFIFTIILGIIGIIFSEFIPVRTLIIMQLFRPTIFLTFFAILFSSYLIMTAFEHSLEKKSLTHLLLAILLFVSIFYYDFKLLLLTLPVAITLLYQRKLQEKISLTFAAMLRKVVVIGTIAVIALCLYSFMNPMFLYLPFYGEQIFLLNGLSYALVPLLFAGLLTLLYKRENHPTKKIPVRMYFLLFLVFSIAFVKVVDVSTSQSDDPCYKAPSVFDFQEHFQYPSFTETSMYTLSIWARENTPKDALFMLPVQCGNDFRSFGQRSVFVDFKYGTMSTFSIDFTLQWFERIRDLNPQREYKYHTFYNDIIEDYRRLDQQRITYLAGKYKIDYGVFEKPKLLVYPVAYENDDYVVYALQQGNKTQ